MWCVVHGDDFSFVGYDSDLDFIVKVLQQEYEIKVRGRLGPGPRDTREIDILGRPEGCYSMTPGDAHGKPTHAIVG